jgi:hypothetical protein
MTKRLPAEPAPGPLEDYAQSFDRSLRHSSSTPDFSPLPPRVAATRRAQ